MYVIEYAPSHTPLHSLIIYGENVILQEMSLFIKIKMRVGERKGGENCVGGGGGGDDKRMKTDECKLWSSSLSSLSLIVYVCV